MLKPLIPFLFIFLFFSAAFAQHAGDLTPHPETLIIDMDKKKWKSSIKKPENARITRLVINGKFDDKQWKFIYNRVIQVDTILAIEFNSNELFELPEGVSKIGSLEQLVFSDNSWLDLESMIDSIKNLPNLKELHIEIFTEADKPKNLEELPQRVAVHSMQVQQIVPAPYEINEMRVAGQVNTMKTEDNSNSVPPLNQFSKFVNPPIKNADIKMETTIITTAAPNIIRASDGSILKVPAKAFVLPGGKVYNGVVKLAYRSFTNPLDFMLSGIPMDFDSAGESIPFVSAGMFELRAFTENDKPLELANDKSIGIDFRSVSADTLYNLYSLSDSTGKWREELSASQLNRPELRRTRAYQEYKKVLLSNSPRYDHTKFADRFYDKKYIYVYRYKNNHGRKFRTYYAIRNNGIQATSPRKKEKGFYITKLIKFSSRGFSKDSSYKFMLKINHVTHPELRELSKYTFMIPDITRAESVRIRQKYISGKRYSDVKLEAEGTSMKLILKDTSGLTEFEEIKLCRYNKFTRKYSMVDEKKMQAIMKGYNRTYARRERNINKAIDKGLLSLNMHYIHNTDSIQEYAWNAARPFMTEEEKAFSFDEWKEFYAKLLSLEARYSYLSTAEATVSYTLNIMRLGIYNCDQIRRIPEPRTDFITMREKKEEGEEPYVAYVICKGQNSVFRYFYGGSKGISITYPGAQDSRAAVIFMNKKNQIFVGSYDAFSAYRNGILNGSNDIKTQIVSFPDGSDVQLEINRLLQSKGF